MKINDCYNFDDFRKLAKRKLPAPIFHYIDGGADDDVTLNRNTQSFNKIIIQMSKVNRKAVIKNVDMSEEMQ